MPISIKKNKVIIENSLWRLAFFKKYNRAKIDKAKAFK